MGIISTFLIFCVFQHMFYLILDEIGCNRRILEEYFENFTGFAGEFYFFGFEKEIGKNLLDFLISIISYAKKKFI